MMSLNHMAETTNMIDTGKGEGRKVYRTPHLHAIRAVTLCWGGHGNRNFCWAVCRVSHGHHEYIQKHRLERTTHTFIPYYAPDTADFRHVISQHGPQTRSTLVLDLQHQIFVLKSQTSKFRSPISMNRLHLTLYISELRQQTLSLKPSNLRGVWSKAEFPVRGLLLQSSHLRLQTLAREAPKP